MGQPTDQESFPDCTRCGHAFEEHLRPEGKHLPWPCRQCECPGFVVSRELHEDARHMGGLRLDAVLGELLDQAKMSRHEVEHLCLSKLDRLEDERQPDLGP